MYRVISLLLGWIADLLLGDPARLPHPVVWFGRAIAYSEHRLNKGSHRLAKGAVTAVGLITLVFVATWFVRRALLPLPAPCLVIFDAVAVFYCLAGTTLIREVRAVFMAVDRSIDEGRKQVARIVGRDTSNLTAQEVRTAALETLAENLSDGVIAPLFWYAFLGTPGMLAFKMVNTLDSMIGYRTERYRKFGCWAAHIDDVANYIPARLTAVLMILSEKVAEIGKKDVAATPSSKGKAGTITTSFRFLCRYGHCHASPNSGYPEAALAAILDCRFGGPHYYFGELFDKPYIGMNDRPLTTADMKKAVWVNRTAEVLMVLLAAGVCLVL